MVSTSGWDCYKFLICGNHDECCWTFGVFSNSILIHVFLLDTRLEINPWQKIPDEDIDSRCVDKTDFVNPLYGDHTTYGNDKNKKYITVRVDDKDPVVECGFHDTHPINKVENKTLFHFYGQKGADTLESSNFFYNISVCRFSSHRSVVYYSQMY